MRASQAIRMLRISSRLQTWILGSSGSPLFASFTAFPARSAVSVLVYVAYKQCFPSMEVAEVSVGLSFLLEAIA